MHSNSHADASIPIIEPHEKLLRVETTFGRGDGLSWLCA